MKIIKIKHRLILREPEKPEKVLWTGTKKECEKKRLEYSFTYNSEFLHIEEKISDRKEVKFTISGLLGFMLMAGLVYLNWIREDDEKVCVTD